MPKLPLIGTFAESQSKDASLGRIVNMYAERDQASPGKLIFYPTAGARAWKEVDDMVTMTGTGIYGTHEYNSNLYIITEDEFPAITSLGAVATPLSGMVLSGDWTDLLSVDMADNYVQAGSQVLMVNGTAAYLWVSTTNAVRVDSWDSGVADSIVANSLADSTASWASDADVRIGTKVRNTTDGTEAYVTGIADKILTLDADIFPLGTEAYELGDSDFPKATSVEYIDGYFLANNFDDTANRGRFYWSDTFEGRDWNSLNFAEAETKSDDLLAIRVVGKNIYLIGAQTTEIRYNAGTPTNPFKLKHVMGIGTSHPKSIAKYGDSLVMVGKMNDRHGGAYQEGSVANGNQVMIINGAQQQVISDPKLEAILNDHRVVNGATVMYGSIYELGGHSFYRLYISDAITPENQITSRVFVYDLKERTWHEETTEYSTGVTLRGSPFYKYIMFPCFYNNGTGNKATSNVLGVTTDSLYLYEIAPEAMGNIDMSTELGINQSITRELISIPIHQEDDRELRHKRVTIEVTTGQRAAAIRGVSTSTTANKLVCDYMHFTDDAIVDNTMTVHNLTDGTSAAISSVDQNDTLTLASDIMVAGDEWVIDTGTDPDITLEWTDDGGVTWKGPLTASMGAADDDVFRIVFNNLGVSRKRSYRIRGDDLGRYIIADAYVDVSVYGRN